MMTLSAAVLAVVSSDPGGGFNPLSYLVQFGIVGVILLCVATETLFVTKKTMDRAIEERDKTILALQADNDDLKRMQRDGTELYNTQVVPALVRAVDLNKDYLDILRRDTPPASPRTAARGRNTS